ncbi:MAG: hypothetical protein ACOC80_06425 [Petrotogales bacterium]
MRKSIAVVLLLFLLTLSMFSARLLKISADNIESSSEKTKLTGNVYIEKEEEFTVETDEATLTSSNGEWRFLDTSGLTHIIFSTGEATGMKLNYDINSSEGALHKNVVAKINTDDDQEILIRRAEKIEFKLEEDYYKGNSLPKSHKDFSPIIIFYKGDMEARALFFEYFANEDRFHLKDDVFVLDKKNNREINASELWYDTQDDSFEGSNVQLQITLEED